jgi:hypothetical protein
MIIEKTLGNNGYNSLLLLVNIINFSYIYYLNIKRNDFVTLFASHVWKKLATLRKPPTRNEIIAETDENTFTLITTCFALSSLK